MARIYIGRATGIGSFERHVVLKMILPERANDEMAVQMFLDEARLAASLNHQNVAQVFEVGEDVGIHFLAMEYVHGQDLRALLARAGSQGTRVPLELALTVVAGAAAGLHHAHERRTSDGTPMGIVHRDVSPSNIMIGYDGAVKLLDFGIAKAAARSVETQSGVIKGKFAYMAPEQCRGRDVDARSDVFSIGIILYEVTTQHRCFRADSDFDTMHRIVTGDIVRPTRLVQGYPPALEAVVMRALSVDPAQRYQSAGLLLEAIESFAMASRMSLSTMALGRFMRDTFGDVPEPWLASGRLSQPSLAAKEQTVSSTHDSGGRSRGRGTAAPPPSGSSPAAPSAPTGSSSGIRRPPSQPLVPPMRPPTGPAAPPATNPGSASPVSSSSSTASSGPAIGPGLAHEDAPLHLPAEALELSPGLADEPPGSATLQPSPIRIFENPPSESGRRSRPHAQPPGFAAQASQAASAERLSSPSLAGSPSPFHAPVARATGLAGGSQPIPPPQQFSQRTGSGSGAAHGRLSAPQVTPRQGYAAASPSSVSNPRYELPIAATLPTAPVMTETPLREQRSHRWAYIALGLVLIGIIVLLMIAIARGGEDGSPSASVETPSAPAQAAPSTPPPAPPLVASSEQAASGSGAARTGDLSGASDTAWSTEAAEASISIHVSSTPSGADVLLAGTPVGTTPLDIQVKRKTGHAVLTVHRARFQDVTASIDLSTSYSNDVKLVALDPVKAAPPAPAASRSAAAATKRPGAQPPASPSKKCQPQDQYNPFDDSCGGHTCPRCELGGRAAPTDGH